MAQPITFELFAPYNESVRLLGSWNDWQPLPMQRGEDRIWRVDVPLDDGTYQYKFEVVSLSYFALGKTVVVSDPKAMRYSLDSRENSIITIVNGQKVDITYTWQHDDKPLPPNDQLIIYEMHVGNFRGGTGDDIQQPGTFQRVIEKLDYLVDLGVTAIELMPVNEFPGHHSWGYSLRSIYAIENSYGTPDDLCQLVDECHKRGIRVIHDAVYNHMEQDAPLTQIDYAYWFYVDNPDDASLDFGPKFNYEKFDENLGIFPARIHVLGSMYQSVDQFHVDGIRFDATRAIKYFDLLRWFHNEVHTRVDHKPFYTIAEHVPQDPAVAGPDGPMDAAWHERFARQLRATIATVPLEGFDPFNTDELLRLMDGRTDGFAGTFNTVKYISSHDESHIMWLLGAEANIFGEAAFRRCKLGAALLLTAPGIPMIWMGQEMGEAAPRTIERQPVDWALLNNPGNQGLFQHYRFLIALRKSTPALTSGNFEIAANLRDRGIIAYKRWNDAGSVVLVVANLRDEYAGDFAVGDAGLEDGTWHEAVYNYDVQVQGGVLADKLGESDVKIYIKA